MVDAVEPVKKKKNPFFYFLWWNVDEDELIKQVTEYDTLKFYQSSRGLSVLLLLLSAAITTAFYFFEQNPFIFIDVFFILLFALLIFFKQRWAIIGAMIFWTIEKLLMIFEGNPIISLMWWALYMRVFFLAWKVEGIRQQVEKNNPPSVPSPPLPPTN